MNRKIDVKRLTITAIMAAAACVLGPISIPLPISLVPISACTLVFYLFSYLLRARDCAAACLIYMLLGLVGLPVFSGFRGGMGALLSVTGGYLIGFAFSGLVYWAITAAVKKDSLIVQVCSLLAALFVCYAFGTLWFVLVYLRGGSTVSVGLVLMKCVVPYLIPDFAKLALSVTIAKAVKKHAKR